MQEDQQRLPAKARTYIIAMTLLGLGVLALAGANWSTPDLLQYGGLLVVGIFCSGMKVSVPGVSGTLSLTFLFVLFGVVELNRPETVIMGALLTLLQCFWNQSKRPRPIQVMFNVAAMALAASTSSPSVCTTPPGWWRCTSTPPSASPPPPAPCSG